LELPTWRNWARNQRSTARVVAPRSLAELKAAVAQAAQPGPGGERRRVRASGGRYSWSPLVPDPHTIVSTRRLKRIEVQPALGRVRAEAGATIGAIERAVSAEGFTLRSPTLFPRPTLGGVLAVGGHHTNRNVGCLSDSLVSLEIVDATGALRSVARGDPDFPAAQVSLGALGVVYAATLELERQFSVYRDLRRVPVEEVLVGLRDLEADTEFLELFWWPFQDTMWVYRMSRTDDPPDPKTWDSVVLQQLDTAIEQYFGGKLLPWVAGHMPRLTPLISKLANTLANRAGVKVLTASDAFHFQKAYPKNWDMQFAVPLGAAEAAWREAIALVNRHASAGLYPMNLALHARFTGESPAWLAPNYGRRTCFIEAVTVQSTRGWEEFFRLLEERWLSLADARPHWGKLFWRWDTPRHSYPRWQEFCAVRQRWDPQGVFLNEWLERDIGL
jgi:L-gulonolactone oxidase